MLKVGDICKITDGNYTGCGSIVRVIDEKHDPFDKVTVLGLTGVAANYKAPLYYKESALTLIYSSRKLREFLC